MTEHYKVTRWFQSDPRPSISAERDRDGETWRVEFVAGDCHTAKVWRRSIVDEWLPVLSVEFTGEWENFIEDTEAGLAVLVESIRDDYALQVLRSLAAESGA